MAHVPQILLNDKPIDVKVPNSVPLLDFIRNHIGLKGTKIGCREGDCGACVVMIGTMKDEKVEYQTLTSCLTPIANVIGKHVVTIEGLNLSQGLNKVQEVLVEHGGTQCGACTPGFIVSILNGVYDFIENRTLNLMEYIDGNICRCTGYKSIERAIKQIQNEIMHLDLTNKPLNTLVENRFLPSYFETVIERIKRLNPISLEEYNSQMRIISGGTDLFVQIPEKLTDENLFTLHEYNSQIIEDDTTITIGGSCSATQIMNSKAMRNLIPRIAKDFSLIASTPIRNIATIAGNIVNGSPIADMVIYLLPFQPVLKLKDLNTNSIREIDLSSLYLKYKTLDKTQSEIVVSLVIEKPKNSFKFNFEKISKRTILDIASVNTAFLISVDNDLVTEIQISAGGVYEIPKLLNSAKTMLNKHVNEESIQELLVEIDREISPISDVRGSDMYKRRLLKNLVIAHFLECFSENLEFEELVA